MAAARLVTSRTWARVCVAIATVNWARRLSCSARCTTSLVLPAPGGEATTTAGSPDQAANNAAARIGSVWCGAAGIGGGSGVSDGVGAERGIKDEPALSMAL